MAFFVLKLCQSSTMYLRWHLGLNSMNSPFLLKWGEGALSCYYKQGPKPTTTVHQRKEYTTCLMMMAIKTRIYQLTRNEKIGEHFEFNQSISGIENHLQVKSLCEQSIIMHGSQTISTSSNESTLLLNGFPILTYVSYGQQDKRIKTKECC